MLSAEQYFIDRDYLSRSALKLFAESRVEYYHTYVTGLMPERVPSQPMLIGTLLHGVLLEGHSFDEQVAIYPPHTLKSNGAINPTAAEQWRAENAGKVFMKDHEADDLRGAVDAVLANKLLRTVLAEASHMERVVTADVHGVPCKCKPDILCDDGSSIIIYDLKIMEKVDPLTFARSARRFKYWLQDAHYSKVCAAAYNKPVRFGYLAIETKFPFRVQRYFYDHASRENAFTEHQRLVRELELAIAKNEWTDEWEEVLHVNPYEIDDDAMVEVPSDE